MGGPADTVLSDMSQNLKDTSWSPLTGVSEVLRPTDLGSSMVGSGLDAGVQWSEGPWGGGVLQLGRNKSGHPCPPLGLELGPLVVEFEGWGGPVTEG